MKNFEPLRSLSLSGLFYPFKSISHLILLLLVTITVIVIDRHPTNSEHKNLSGTKHFSEKGNRTGSYATAYNLCFYSPWLLNQSQRTPTADQDHFLYLMSIGLKRCIVVLFLYVLLIVASEIIHRTYKIKRLNPHPI